MAMSAVAGENPRGIYRHAKTKAKSHYQFSNYVADASGEISVERLRGRFDNANLISTAIRNPAKGTYSIYGITFDIDADLTDASLLDSEGMVDWEKVRARIEEKLPWLMPRITYAVRSYSGKGIGLLIWIRSVEKVSDNIKVLTLGGALQRRLRELFTVLGVGADPEASGLHRDMANWLDLSRRLYANDIERARVEREHIPVITELLGHVNKHYIENYVAKADRPEVLYPDFRGERPLAHAYLKLFDDYYQGKSRSEIFRMDSSKDLKELLGVSKSLFYKLLKAGGLPWLSIERVEDGFRIEFFPCGAQTERASNIVSGKLKGDRLYNGRLDLSSIIPEPEMVVDGERNSFVTRVAVEMKHCGVMEADACAAIEAIAREIPNYHHSWSARNAARICRSVFFHRSELKEIRLGQALPEFIERTLREQDESKERPATPQKGLSIAPRRSRDRLKDSQKETKQTTNGWLGVPRETTDRRSTTIPRSHLVDVTPVFQTAKPATISSSGKITTTEFSGILSASRLSKNEKKVILEAILSRSGFERDSMMCEWAQKLGGKKL